MSETTISPSSITLVLGGARSGKSTYAEQLAVSGERVLFVATAEAGDDDMAQRIANHRATRPSTWDTVEEPLALSIALGSVAGRYDTIVIDCLTVWVSNVMFATSQPQQASIYQDILDAYIDELIAVMQSGNARWIIVSNEVGLGVVPATELGRQYRDLLGRVNQRVAGIADNVVLMVAGLPMKVKSPK